MPNSFFFIFLFFIFFCVLECKENLCLCIRGCYICLSATLRNKSVTMRCLHCCLLCMSRDWLFRISDCRGEVSPAAELVRGELRPFHCYCLQVFGSVVVQFLLCRSEWEGNGVLWAGVWCAHFILATSTWTMIISFVKMPYFGWWRKRKSRIPPVFPL